jgi:hypothetical protein
MAKYYHAFLDESGQREYGRETDRYYVVAGVIAVRFLADRYDAELSGIKRLFFGDPSVELKSNWLRQPHERKKRYIDPYGITKARVKEFTDAFYEWLLKTKLRVIAGVVDKHQMQKVYPHPHYPSAVGYNIFLQRYQQFLRKRKAKGLVTWDQMTGKSPAGNEWKRLLSQQHRKLLRYGCPYTQSRFTCIEERLGFVDSSVSGLIQIADLAAYNVFRQFKDNGSTWDNPRARKLPLYSFFGRMLPRFDYDASHVLAGYGVAKMPCKFRHQWRIPENGDSHEWRFLKV